MDGRRRSRSQAPFPKIYQGTVHVACTVCCTTHPNYALLTPPLHAECVRFCDHINLAHGLALPKKRGTFRQRQEGVGGGGLRKGLGGGARGRKGGVKRGGGVGESYDCSGYRKARIVWSGMMNDLCA